MMLVMFSRFGTLRVIANAGEAIRLLGIMPYVVKNKRRGKGSCLVGGYIETKSSVYDFTRTD